MNRRPTWLPRVPLPTPVKRVIRRWWRRLRSRLRSQTRRTVPAAGRTISRRMRAHALLAEVDQLVPPTPRPRLDVTVGVAASDWTAAGLSWEWNQQRLTPTSWRQLVGAAVPDLVLVEYADDMVPGWGPPEDGQLPEFLSWCKANAVQVVVWVTSGADDPGRAAPLVSCADRLFVHAPGAVDTWRARFEAHPVDVLLPATQPRVHHRGTHADAGQSNLAAALVLDPAGVGPKTADTLQRLVGPGLGPLSSTELDVWAIGDDPDADPIRREIPDELGTRVVGTRPYEKIAALLPRYRVLVDTGLLDSAATWSLLDAGAAHTSVVLPGGRPADLPPDLAACVAVADSPLTLRGEVVARIHQPELRDRMALRLNRAVLAGHTYAHRTEQILASLGRTTPGTQRTVSAVVPTNREGQLPTILANVARQRHPDLEVVLVLHGLDLAQQEIRARARDLGIGHLTIVDADKTVSLGACMNLGIDAASGAYIAKMDDDNYYGAHYLTDLVASFDYTDAGVVGKWAHYVWLRATGAVVLRYVAAEHRYERRVQGGSMVIRGDLARALKFADLPRGVDTDFLDRARGDGVRIYSADRFNFVSIRGTDRSAHTWQAADTTFLTASGRLAFYGDPRAHVDV